MTKYSISTHNYIGSGPTIVAREDGTEIPSVIFSQLDRDFPFDTGMIARNFVALANGQSPSETLPSAGRAIFYEGLPGAVALRFQGEDGGLTKSGLMITINQAAPDHIVGDLSVRVDDVFMRALCDAVQMPGPGAPAPSTQQGLRR